MNHINYSKPPHYEDGAKKQVWKDVMVEEYKTIMNNDVWEVVPKPKRKSIVTSIWIYNIKHATDGSIEKYKSGFVSLYHCIFSYLILCNFFICGRF